MKSADQHLRFFFARISAARGEKCLNTGLKMEWQVIFAVIG